VRIGQVKKEIGEGRTASSAVASGYMGRDGGWYNAATQLRLGVIRRGRNGAQRLRRNTIIDVYYCRNAGDDFAPSSDQTAVGGRKKKGNVVSRASPASTTHTLASVSFYAPNHRVFVLPGFYLIFLTFSGGVKSEVVLSFSPVFFDQESSIFC
jgi:hypothetical protein